MYTTQFINKPVIVMKKIIIILAILVLLSPNYSQSSVAKSTAGEIYEADLLLNYRNVTVYAPAVAQTESGNIGIISTITVTIQSHGSGRVFVDTLPLTEIDMQGSARLAVKVATALVENDKNSTADPSVYDYFFVVRTTAPIIGGPSAGGVMTVATVALLQNWDMSNTTVMTGMINPDGSIGPIGGILQKIDAANSVGATRFLLPKGQSTKAIEDYAENNYIIEVVEVADINEALKNFTEYGFTYDESNGEITTEDYITSMKPLASRLLEDADELYQQADSLFDRVKSKIPNYNDLFNDYHYRDEIRGVLHDSEDLLEESEEWFNGKMYYTSLTLSFLSLMDSQFVYYACQYFDEKEADRGKYIMDLISEITVFYNEKKDLAQDAEIEGMISLQGIGAAQKRSAEAATFISYANSSYFAGSPLSALTYLARAKQRSNSVEWWVNISSHFNDTGEISATEIDALALEYINDAEQAIVYSQILLKEIGEVSSYITGEGGAEALLESAKDDRENNYPAAALFEALEALVKANLAIETLGIDSQETLLDKLERANKSAASNIIKSRNQGIEPILAVSYYEYAQSLANKSEYDSALFYYKYSGMIAGALSFTNVSEETAESRYIGKADENERSIIIQNDMDYTLQVLLTVFAVIAGIGIGLIIGGISSDKSDERKHKKIRIRRLNDASEKKHYCNEGDMPRSIQDYYKKKK